VAAIGAPKNVVLNDPLPTLGGALTWTIPAGGDPSGKCTVVANTLNCPFGDLANGDTRTVMIETTVPATAAGCGTLNNLATVTTDNAGTRSDPGSQSCADFTVVKTPDAGTYAIGDKPKFTIVVTAIGAPK